MLGVDGALEAAAGADADADAGALEAAAALGAVAKVVGTPAAGNGLGPLDGTITIDDEAAPYEPPEPPPLPPPGTPKKPPAAGVPEARLMDTEGERPAIPLSVVAAGATGPELDGTSKPYPESLLVGVTGEVDGPKVDGKAASPESSEAPAPVPAPAVTVTIWTEVLVMVDVRTLLHSDELASAGATGRPDETALTLLGTLEKPESTEAPEDSRGMGLTVTVMTPVATGDSTGEPPRSVPLVGVVPFMGNMPPVGIAKPEPVPVPWWW